MHKLGAGGEWAVYARPEGKVGFTRSQEDCREGQRDVHEHAQMTAKSRDECKIY